MSILIYRNSENRVYKIFIRELEQRLEIKYLNSLIFEREKYRERVIKKAKKYLKRPGLKQMNSWTLALHKRAMEQPQKDFFYIRWINNCLGYGVFAAQDIPALCYIGEYAGMLRKRHFRKDRFNNYIFGYVVAGKGTSYIIDAKEQGNFTRFINHNGIHPNLTSRWVIKDQITHIIFFANKLILKGQQLTYDYGDCYWRSRTFPSLID